MSDASQPPQSQGTPNIPGPPYPPPGAAVGGRPTVSVDVPISAVFIAIFLIGAASHMRLFRLNKSRGHKFTPSAATFGFCMARTVANILRIACATRPTNTRLAIAAQVFVAAGVIILFILNLLYTQRMLRAAHPRLGWSRPLSFFFKGLYALIIITLIMVITATVQSFHTLNTNTRRIDRNLQLYGSSYMVFFSFLPLPMLAYILLVPRRQPNEQFGAGSWSAKVLTVGTASVLLCLGAGFRLGTAAMPPRPQTDPAWYHHKACFYVFNFLLEAMVVYLYLFMRVDRRFHVPDGSSKVRNYSDNKADRMDSNQASVSNDKTRENDVEIGSISTL